MRETGGGGGDQAPQQFFKIVILGESAVGKSSLLNKYVYGKFSENRESTIQVREFCYSDISTIVIFRLHSRRKLCT